jgi:hypothetical protein
MGLSLRIRLIQSKLVASRSARHFRKCRAHRMETSFFGSFRQTRVCWNSHIRSKLLRLPIEHLC